MSIAIAVIGAGFMGERWARAIHEHAGAHVAVIGDVDEGRGRALAERFSARFLGDAEEAAAAAGVDAVVVCTPEHLHLAPAQAARGRRRRSEDRLDVTEVDAGAESLEGLPGSGQLQHGGVQVAELPQVDLRHLGDITREALGPRIELEHPLLGEQHIGQRDSHAAPSLAGSR